MFVIGVLLAALSCEGGQRSGLVGWVMIAAGAAALVIPGSLMEKLTALAIKRLSLNCHSSQQALALGGGRLAALLHWSPWRRRGCALRPLGAGFGEGGAAELS